MEPISTAKVTPDFNLDARTPRRSMVKRKAPPSAPAFKTEHDAHQIETSPLPDPRYPAFDPHDPFAPLSDLRRRSYSFAYFAPNSNVPGSGHGGLYDLNLPAFSQSTTNLSIGGGFSPQRQYILCPDPPPVSSPAAPRVGTVSVTGSQSPCQTQSQAHTIRDRPQHAGHHYLQNQFTEHNRSQSNLLSHISRPRPRSRLTSVYTPPLTPDNSSEETVVTSTCTSPTRSRFILRMFSTAPNCENNTTIKHAPAHEAPSTLASSRSTSPSPSSSQTSSEDSPPLYPFPPSAPSKLSLLLGSHSNTSSSSLVSYRRKSRILASEDMHNDGYVTSPELHSEKKRRRESDLTYVKVSKPQSPKADVKVPRAINKSRSKAPCGSEPCQNPTTFSESRLPTIQQLSRASELVVVSESGVRVRFGDLWEDDKCIVIFIRHFWCTACQDYMRALSSDPKVQSLDQLGIKVVVIGLGSPALITPYRHLTKLSYSPVEIYTDPTLALHHALGMTLKSTNPGPASERGGYTNHGLLGGVRRVVFNALSRKLPLSEKGGDIGQLGGEFVLGPGLSCSYAHRMKNTRSHATLANVISAGGINVFNSPAYSKTYRSASHSTDESRDESRSRHVHYAMQQLSHRQCPRPGSSGTSSSESSLNDEDAWMESRRLSLMRIKEKRMSRRAGMSVDVLYGLGVEALEDGQLEYGRAEIMGRINGQEHLDDAVEVNVWDEIKPRFPIMEDEQHDDEEV